MEDLLMIEEIIYFPILGIPLIVWLGVVTLLLLLGTAAIAWLNMRGMHAVPVKWHMILARISIGFAILHAVLGLVY
jgi:hypothetical protein